MLDYYAILDVPTDASIEDIKRAYRSKAHRCHPDHGGSHEQMLLINEAFEVLRNPALRREYDYVRVHQADADAQRAAAVNAAKAREAAAHYPHDWAAFEAWLNRFAEDVQRAEYGQTSKLVGNMSLPTAGGSASGWALIIFAALLGGVISDFFVPRFGVLGIPTSESIYLYPFLIGAFIGAWIGRGLHQLLKDNLSAAPQTSMPQTVSAPTWHIIACPRCSQKLRLPEAGARMRITCPSCKQQFEQSPL